LAQLVVRNPSGPADILYSKEGVTQGDPLSMILYGIALLPLAETLKKALPSTTQPWYADDACAMGRAHQLNKFMTLLQRHGPPRGYFPEPRKSIVICRTAAEQTRLTELLQKFEFQFVLGSRYLGGYIGSHDTMADWITPRIDKWCAGVRLLAQAARRYPQSAFAGLTKSLQAEWQYLQRVTPDVAPFFEPLETALAHDFFPALFQDKDFGHSNHELLGLAAKRAGLGVPNPTSTASKNLEASQDITGQLATSLVLTSDLDVTSYCQSVRTAQTRLRGIREEDEKATLTELLKPFPPFKLGDFAELQRRVLGSQ